MKGFKKKIDSVLLKFGDFLSLGGTKKDIIFLVISGISLILSILKVIKLPFNIAWVSIILCGLPIVFEAILGILNPVVGALVHNAGSVLVVINSALLLNWKRRNTK